MKTKEVIGHGCEKFNRKEAKAMANYIEKFDRTVMSAVARKIGTDLHWYVSCRTTVGHSVAFHNEGQYRSYAQKNESPEGRL